MATVGLKGIWGLEHLDRTGIATWKLGVLLISSGVLVGFILIPVLGDVNPEVAMSSQHVISLLLVLTSSAFGFYLFATIAIARTTEADLRSLLEIDQTVGEGIALLKPTARLLGISIFVAVVLFEVMAVAMDIIIFDMSVSERFSKVHRSGLVLNVVNYLLLPMMGVVAGTLMAVFISQSQSLIFVVQPNNRQPFLLGNRH